MHIQELVLLGPKTTMRIGGKAKYFAELKTKSDVEEVWKFTKEKGLPFIVLGGGSNTIFADGTIEALVVRITAQSITIHPAKEGSSRNNEITNKRINVTVEAGLPLATLITKLSEANLDLSPLTGIPGTLGGAIFGNAGQGPQGVWIDHFVERVTAFVDGQWRSFTRGECGFRYRESTFKTLSSPLIWEVLLHVPTRPQAEIEAEIGRLLKKRQETQPAALTAGSCFKALPDGTPAWKAIDAANLRGKKVGGIAVSEKHANFLINKGEGSFENAVNLIRVIREKTGKPLTLEMRLIGENGVPWEGFDPPRLKR